MSHHDTTVPLSVIDPADDGDGEIAVSFDWTPGQAASGHHGSPEDYDPGSSDEFYIVSATLTASPLSKANLPAEGKIIAWLDENWDRPEPHEPDYYTEAKDRRMERDD